MAPILSKAIPPPRTSQEKIERWVKRARPLLDTIFEILQEVGLHARLVKADAETAFDSLRVRLDSACIGCVRLLESLCCLDLNRYAKPEKPLTGNLPILFVLMLIVMLYNAFVFGYMPAAGIAVNSSTSLLFHAWIFMVLASFAQAVRTEPGRTPNIPRWRDKDRPPPEARERKRGSQEARWCRKSGAYKPDRAHYCRVLQQGVLRMDHYCPWLGNTVGFHNQKFFFLFLFYTNVACAHLGINFIQLLVQYTLPAITTFCLVGAEGLTVLLGSLLVPFFLFHLWLVARNMTTIEFCERMRDTNDGDQEASESALRYDIGIFRNFGAVLGPNPLLWLIPVGGPTGDGIIFPINPEYQSATETGAAAAGSEKKRIELAPPVGTDDGPEATHPAACSVPAKGGVESADDESGDGEHGGSNEVREDSGEEDDATYGYHSAQSEGGDGGFLVWRNSAEFVEDLTIGCQFIGEKVEDCTRGSISSFLSSCGSRVAARRLAAPRQARCRQTLSLRASTAAVRVVPARGGGVSSSGEGDGGEGSSRSGEHPDSQDHFLSD